MATCTTSQSAHAHTPLGDLERELSLAVKRADRATIERLLEEGADVNYQELYVYICI